MITQYHSSIMFAPNCVGTANATTAGWGNLGGGVTQMVTPLILGAVLFFGVSASFGWRLAMVIPGVMLFLTGIGYYFFTQDAPDGNYKELRERGELPPAEGSSRLSFWLAAQDSRVWALFIIYAACFGAELTIHNVAALYYHDYFGLDIKTAGLTAGLFGLLSIFDRTLGGILSDRAAVKSGLKGRVLFLGTLLLAEGFALIIFSQMTVLPLAVISMILFGLFVHMSCGATFAIVPFINKKALGGVAGIVGAGGNAGAVAAGFLFRSEGLSSQEAFLILGIAVIIASGCIFLVTFPQTVQEEEQRNLEKALAEKETLVGRELAPAIGA